MLNVVLTHLPARAVDEHVRYLQELAPSARLAVCHGGEDADFAQVRHDEKMFVDDPSLRGAPRMFQSYHAVFSVLHQHLAQQPEDIQSIYILEYDHLVLRADFEEKLTVLANATGADFMGKTCLERTGTNWGHYARFRSDSRLLSHLARVSVRSNPTRMYGCLGNGFWLTREALAAYVAVEAHPPCYGELYVPTLLHHLGFELVDIDTHSDLYDHVRWAPPFTLEEALWLKRSGATFVHPFKDFQAVGRVHDAPEAVVAGLSK